MKKILLGAAAVALAASATAQVEIGFMDADSILTKVATKHMVDDGKGGEKEAFALASGTVLVKTENVEMVYPNGDDISRQNSSFNGFKTIIVNGQAINIIEGIGGSDNGKGDLNGPTSGCMYQLNVKKDGWMIVVSKISSNKPFYVFEGLQGADPVALAYTLGMDLQSDKFPEIPQVNYTLPATDMGYVNREAADIDDYTFGTEALGWPIRIQTGNADAESAGNGTGALVFPVYADAEHYLVLATGSKMNTCGYIFVDSDPDGVAPSVAVYCPEDLESEKPRNEKMVVITGETPEAPDAVEAVAAALDVNAPIYNAQGVRVNADAKGLLIQNGKKFIRK